MMLQKRINIYQCLVGVLLWASTATAQVVDDLEVATRTIAEQIAARTDGGEGDPEGLSLFRDALLGVNLYQSVLGDGATDGRQFTVFAPTNQAIRATPLFTMYLTGIDEQRWYNNLQETIRQHFVDTEVVTRDEIFDGVRNELTSVHGDSIVINQYDFQLQKAKFIEQDIPATNGILHVIDAVLFAKFMQNSFAALEEQFEYGPDLDPRNRTSLVTVVDVIKGRDTLENVQDSGQTFAGCRLRAFNRLDEYLPQSNIPGLIGDVVDYEFLNTTNSAATRENLLEYSMLPKNYYSERIDNGFQELILPNNPCGHMWVTKRDNKLCFNNGCVVEVPDFRQYLSSNGVGFVINKCLVCPGVAMLANITADFTSYKLDDTAKFFRASEWNLRDLALSVGDGTQVTLFAAANSGWDGRINQRDKTRLATDKWKPHQWDLLRHMMVQGKLTHQDLQERFTNEGIFNLTTLAKQTIEIAYNDATSKLTIEGGDIFFTDIQGVDGLLHLTNAVPTPISVTHTVYDVAKEIPEFSTQILYIDTVRLAEDMRTLLPLTAGYVNNKEWKNQGTDYTEIAKTVLENHMFEDLYYCDTLLKMSTISSHNGQEWLISVNEETGMPCFETANVLDEKPPKACIIKCDIYARNGVVHEFDKLMLYEIPPTRPPSLFDDDDQTASSPADTTPVRPPSTYVRPVAQLGNEDEDLDADSVSGGVARSTTSAVVISTVMSILFLCRF